MKLLFHSVFCITIQICVLFFPFMRMNENRRFVVISDWTVAINFYSRIHQTTSRHFRNEHQEIDEDTEIQICKDVTSSHLFRKYYKRLYQRKFNRISRQINQFICNSPNTARKSIEIRLSPHSTETFNEYDVFRCLIRQIHGRNKKYYISKEYDLNTNSNTSHEEYFAGRFIFKKSRKLRLLFGLAELPGETFLSQDHNIERIYLERRKNYGLHTDESNKDALCGLNIEERYRICVAVFNSNYFKGRITYSNDRIVGTICEVHTVSFQTEYGKIEAAKQIYKSERMLNCNGIQHYSYFNKANYFLSQAYESNQVFVFFRDNSTEKIFLENLTTNVRLTFIPQKHSETPIPVQSSFEFPFQTLTFGALEWN